MPPRAQKNVPVVPKNERCPLVELVNEEDGGVGLSVQDRNGKSLTLLLPGAVFSRLRRTVMDFRRGDEEESQILELGESQCLWAERKAG